MMLDFLADLGEFFLTVIGAIISLYVLYLIYFKSNINIPDEDLDKVSKGGEH